MWVAGKFTRFITRSGATPLGDQLPIQGIDAHLMRQLSDVNHLLDGIKVDRIGFEKAGSFLKEVSVCIENLDAVIGPVANPNTVVFIDADTMR